MREEQDIPVGDPSVQVTTTEPVHGKADVAGYEPQPVVELHEGELGCEFCGCKRFRRSRIRFRDMMELLMLRYPVRCVRCGQRQFFDLTFALLAHAPKSHVSRVAEGTDTWQSWTKSNSGTQDAPSPARPLTTAVGPRARRLTQQPTRPVAPPTPPARTPSRSRDDGGIW